MATVNEKMTAIADAIRAKTGGTEPLGLDAMAEAIAGISGLPEKIKSIDGGVYTLTSDRGQTATITVPHGLGEEPDAVVFYFNTAFDSYSGYYYAFSKMRVRVYDTSMGEYRYVSTTYACRNSDGYVTGSVNTSNNVGTDTSFDIFLASSGLKLRKGSYVWAAVKFA